VISWIKNIFSKTEIEVKAKENLAHENMFTFIKPKRKVARVFLHCSASDNPAHDDVSVMRKWHLEKGWADVGYHYFIKKDGTVQKGRNLELTPSAQKGYNTNSIAICLHGLDKSKFTPEQFKALRIMCFNFNFKYQGKITFHGHCEVSAKACPVFDYKKVLELDDKGFMNV
jgi:N-acetylmuramoyl-L-alanine amidase